MTSKALFLSMLLLLGSASAACRNSDSGGGLAPRKIAKAPGRDSEQVSLRRTGLTTGVPRDPSAAGYLNLHKRHPDGDECVDEFNNAYSPAQALQRLEQINGFLDSFSTLTRKARSRLSAAELRSVGNTQGDMQTIGFHNIPLLVEGTILKQDYQLKQSQPHCPSRARNAGANCRKSAFRLSKMSLIADVAESTLISLIFM